MYATAHRGHGRTRLRSGHLGDAGPDAWNRMVEDEIALSQRLRAAHPGAPLVLFGHSLGSRRRTTSSAASSCSTRWC
jgi:alpha-beta hydrolase superfamily lysophospholipase